MYSVKIGTGAKVFTKYFSHYHEAKQYVKSLGWTTRKIKSVH